MCRLKNPTVVYMINCRLSSCKTGVYNVHLLIILERRCSSTCRKKEKKTRKKNIVIGSLSGRVDGGEGDGGVGVGGKGGGGRGGGDNINYLVKIITENKVFHFLRNWMFCLPQIPFFTFISFGFGIFFSLSVSVSFFPSLSYET